MQGLICEICNHRPATSHLTEVTEDGQADAIHICNTCLGELGLDLHNTPVPIETIRQRALDSSTAKEQSLLKPTITVNLAGQSSGSERKVDHDLSCPHCGLSLGRFCSSNRFGCPSCYETFGDQLDKTFMDLHGNNRHVARLPADKDASIEYQLATRIHLRQRLEAAIASEHFEVAADLRDQLRELEQGDHQ